MGLERIVAKAPRQALSVRAIAGLGQGEEPCGTDSYQDDRIRPSTLVSA
jgi:hypothetical protein